MKTQLYIYIAVSIAMLSPISLLAAENGFAETAAVMVDQLTKPQKPVLRPRSVAAKNIYSTRAVAVRLKEQGKQIDKEIYIEEGKTTSGVKLKVEFDADSPRLRSSSYKILDQLGIALRDPRIAGKQVCIKGHTDSDGTEQYNLNLSYQRALAVRDYVLVHNQINMENIFVVGYGEALALVKNDSYQHKQMNRRVEITLGCSEVQ